MTDTPVFNSLYGVMTIIIMTPVFFLWLEKKVKLRIFNYLPAIIWIFLTPILLSSLHIIPKSSPIYSTFKSFAVPMFIILMLLDINIRQSIRIAWKSAFVLLFGSIGVVIGGAVSFYLFRKGLPSGAWSGFGALAGSWIGGTGNLAAVAESLNTPPDTVGMVVLVDNFVYLFYFPLILMSKRWAGWFDKFTGVSKEEMKHFSKVAADIEKKTHVVHFRDVLTLLGFGFAAILLANRLAEFLPALPPVFTTKTWFILLVTTFGIIMSGTSLKKVPGTEPISMGLVYIYMTMMGAMADLGQIGSAYIFIIAGFVCISIHLLFVALSAKLFKLDVSMAAVASVAAVGGAASAPVAAGYHREELVPVSIMLALLGYALGNYLGVATAYLCHILA